MNIGISAWRLRGPRLGIGRYIEYLLRYWNGLLTPSERVEIFVCEAFDRESLNLSDRFSTTVVRPRLTNALWENLLLPRRARGVDVLLGPSYTVPLAGRMKSVVVIHGVDEAQRGAHNWRYKYTWGQKYRRSAQKASRVIAGDPSTKERLIEHYRIPGEKIDVVSLGVAESFAPIDDPGVLVKTRIEYLGADRPYILFVGKMSPRRNIPTLLKAFADVKARRKIPHTLLLLGPNPYGIPLESLVRELGILDSVVHSEATFSNHHDVAAIYSAADLFVLPSSSEGFSLTLLEAMACGTPAITVRRAGMAYLADGYAQMVDEPTVGALAAAMEEVLFDSTLQQTLRKRELRRAADFSWKRTAEETLNVLRKTQSS